jgi:hypothetical protein
MAHSSSFEATDFLLASIQSDLQTAGFVHCPQAKLREAWPELARAKAWDDFVGSFERLPHDNYMADGGRYRRRRYAVFRVRQAGIERAEHQPHFQSTLYNRLNGGIERWFDPIEPEIAEGELLQAWMRFARAAFAPLRAEVAQWHVEVHQFRIEASATGVAKPTPEGVHRDGVDYVLVALIARERIQAGTTTLHLPDGQQVAEFTLTHAGDCVLLDDQRLLHGVTPIVATDQELSGYRDVLVITLRAC